MYVTCDYEMLVRRVATESGINMTRSRGTGGYTRTRSARPRDITPRKSNGNGSVSYTHLRAHETLMNL
eukprot:4883450-Prymnesium_polylepis.1